MTSEDYVSYSVCYEHYAGATVPARKLTPLTTCILMSVDKKRQRKEFKNYMLHSLTQNMISSLYALHSLTQYMVWFLYVVHSLTQYMISSLYVLHSLTQYMVSSLYVVHSLTQYMISSLYVTRVLYRAFDGHRVTIKRHRQLCATAGRVLDLGGCA